MLADHCARRSALYGVPMPHHEPIRGEHIGGRHGRRYTAGPPTMIVLNPSWPSGDGPYQGPCPGCPACDEEIMATMRWPGASDHDVISAYLAALLLGNR